MTSELLCKKTVLKFLICQLDSIDNNKNVVSTVHLYRKKEFLTQLLEKEFSETS